MKALKKLFVGGLIFFTASTVYGANLWQVEIFARWGGISQRLVLGMAEDATDGFDSTYEVYALFWGGEPIRAYFYHPGWSNVSDFYWRDIRALSSSGTWHFYVEVRQDGNVELTWNTAYAPAEGKLILIEVDQNDNPIHQVDMRKDVSYSFYGVKGTTHHFIVTYKNTQPFTAPSITSVILRGRYVTLTLEYDEARTAEIEIYRIIPRGDSSLIFKGLPAGTMVRDRLDKKALIRLRKHKKSIYYRVVAHSVSGELAESELAEVAPLRGRNGERLARAR